MNRNSIQFYKVDIIFRHIIKINFKMKLHNLYFQNKRKAHYLYLFKGWLVFCCSTLFVHHLKLFDVFIFMKLFKRKAKQIFFGDMKDGEFVVVKKKVDHK